MVGDLILLTSLYTVKGRRSLNYAVARGIVEQPLCRRRASRGQVDRLVRWGALVGPTVEGNMEFPEWRCCVNSEFKSHRLTRFYVEGRRGVVDRANLVTVVC